MNRILTFWIIAAISGFCVAEPVTKTRLAALHPRDGLVVTDVDMSGMLSTNDVCNIVTNEVADGWKITADNPDISLDGWYVELGYVMQMPAMIRHPRWYIKCDGLTYLKTNAFLEDATVLESEAERAIDSNKNGVFDEGEEIITFNVRAEKVSRNALGLATLKDIEGAVTVDKYSTNSVYFIDDDVPTMKLFTSYTRSPYWANRMSAIEIGDRNQVLKTFYAQVDGNLAVNTPANIRFMSTLDRNSAYDQGKSLTLQDYLDAFNPVLVPETLKMFQTNRADFSVGDMRVHETLTVANKEDSTIFSVTEQEANFMNSLVVKPAVGPFLYYEGAKNDEGVVTNYYGFAKTNAEVEVNGNIHVSDSIGVSSNVFVWGNLIINGWDKIYVKRGQETDVNAYHGFRESLGAYFEKLAAPIIAATNEYANGEVFYDLGTRNSDNTDHSKPVYWHYFPIPDELKNDGMGYGWALRDKCNFRVTANAIPSYNYAAAKIELFIKLGLDRPFTSNRIVFDSTGVAATNYVNLGTYNFKGMAGDTGVDGTFETLYSNVEPIERTEAVLRTETYEYENWIWDEEFGDYILDPDQPYITETYEWWDEYTFDMVWQILPGTCVEFDLKRVGETAMRVNVQQIYKTQPYTGN